MTAAYIVSAWCGGADPVCHERRGAWQCWSAPTTAASRFASGDTCRCLTGVCLIYEPGSCTCLSVLACGVWVSGVNLSWIGVIYGSN